MSRFVYVKRFPRKFEKDRDGMVVMKDDKPVEKRQFFKTAQGTVIEVPSNGYVVRNDQRIDVAMTAEDFVAKYERHKPKSTQGLLTANTESWQRYKLRE